MEKYKPQYLGKVIPANDTSKMTDFVENKFDSFSKVYDTCKEYSEKISDLQPVSSDSSNSLAVRVITDSETTENMKESVKDDPSVTVQDGVVTAKV